MHLFIGLLNTTWVLYEYVNKASKRNIYLRFCFLQAPKICRWKKDVTHFTSSKLRERILLSFQKKKRKTYVVVHLPPTKTHKVLCLHFIFYFCNLMLHQEASIYYFSSRTLLKIFIVHHQEPRAVHWISRRDNCFRRSLTSGEIAASKISKQNYHLI